MCSHSGSPRRASRSGRSATRAAAKVENNSVPIVQDEKPQPTPKETSPARRRGTSRRLLIGSSVAASLLALLKTGVRIEPSAMFLAASLLVFVLFYRGLVRGRVAVSIEVNPPRKAR
jgi:hypothetical protein